MSVAPPAYASRTASGETRSVMRRLPAAAVRVVPATVPPPVTTRKNGVRSPRSLTSSSTSAADSRSAKPSGWCDSSGSRAQYALPNASRVSPVQRRSAAPDSRESASLNCPSGQRRSRSGRRRRRSGRRRRRSGRRRRRSGRRQPWLTGYETAVRVVMMSSSVSDMKPPLRGGCWSVSFLVPTRRQREPVCCRADLGVAGAPDRRHAQRRAAGRAACGDAPGPA